MTNTGRAATTSGQLAKGDTVSWAPPNNLCSQRQSEGYGVVETTDLALSAAVDDGQDLARIHLLPLFG